MTASKAGIATPYSLRIKDQLLELTGFVYPFLCEFEVHFCFLVALKQFIHRCGVFKPP
jgi:hypothetical protein